MTALRDRAPRRRRADAACNIVLAIELTVMLPEPTSTRAPNSTARVGATAGGGNRDSPADRRHARARPLGYDLAASRAAQMGCREGT